ncbi:MAG: hypothetical protein IID49_15435 [Proteobacteria bacterium]|nr:hypothetical protein [Pseudomonadota bacterium]
MAVDVKRARVKIRLFGAALLFFAVVVPAISLYLQTVFGRNLFERSGSVVVVSVAVFYAYLEAKNFFVGAPAGTIDGMAGIEVRPVAAPFELLSLVIGTVVWGYGGLISTEVLGR